MNNIIYCWKCGKEIDWTKSYCFQVQWHSKLCPECMEGAFDIFNKYEWEHLPVTGAAVHIKTTMPVAETDWFNLLEYGFQAHYDCLATDFWGPPDAYLCKSMSNLYENNS